MITGPGGCPRWIKFSQHKSDGILSVFTGRDFASVPFDIARIFTIAGVDAGICRGNHAHKRCSQLLVVLNGVAEISITNGTSTQDFTIRSDGRGLLIPPGLWNTVAFEGPQTVLMVICDEPYDPEDYIRDWDCFLDHLVQANHDLKC